MAINLTPENASRDRDALLKEGLFHLKKLGELLGLTDTPEKKMAFNKISTNRQQLVEELLKGLAAYDKEHGAPKAAAPKSNGMNGHAKPVEPEAAAEEVQESSEEEPEEPAEVAAEPEAPKAEAKAEKKAPAAKAEKKTEAAPTGDFAALQQSIDALSKEVAKLQKGLSSIVANAVRPNDLENLTVLVKALFKEDRKAFAGMASLLLQFSENAIEGASREDLVGAALGDFNGVAELLGEGEQAAASSSQEQAEGNA